MKKRAVIFETIRNSHRPWVARAVARGHSVRVFDFYYHLKFLGWLRPLLHASNVERIYFHPASKAEDLGIDAAEWLYPKVSSHPLIRCLQKMFTPDEADTVFKYALAREASQYFFMRLFLEKIHRDEPETEIIFIPDAFLKWHRLLQSWCADRLKPLEGVRIPGVAARWSSTMGTVSRWLRALRLYGWAGFCLMLIGLGRLLPHAKQRAKKDSCHVLYAIASKFQTKFSGSRKFDFLIDNKRLTKTNVAFCVDPVAEGPWVEEAGQKGYQMIRLSDYSGLKGLLFRPPYELPMEPAWRTVLEGLRRLGTPDWIQQAAYVGLRTWIREGGLLERVQFNHYVYASQYALVPRWRNVLIRRAGSESWYYAYSNGAAYLYHKEKNQVFAGGRDFSSRCRFWAYDNADHFVSPCRQLSDYYQTHHQKVRWYHNVGNIWSEQILQMQQKEDLSAVRTRWFPSLKPGQKIVSWFDTSFVEAPNSPSTFMEAIQFYEDILRLTNENPDLFMAIKPSKDAAFYTDLGPNQQWSEPRLGQELMKIWEEMKAHPRIRFFDHSTDPTRVVAAGDLTVTFCFSSVSAEALGARMKGIWYEPILPKALPRWREAHYSGNTGLTAHGYDELKSKVKTLLFQMNDSEYQDYLNEKVLPFGEEHLAGNGLSKFRRLLAGEEEEEPRPLQRETLSMASNPRAGS